jgi:hypothetical protein
MMRRVYLRRLTTSENMRRAQGRRCGGELFRKFFRKNLLPN